MNNFLFLLIIVIPTYYTKKLPPTFKRCDLKNSNFNKCLTEAIPDAIRQLKSPLKQLALPSLDPLVIPAMTIAPGVGPTAFQQNYTQMKVYGLVNVTCQKIDLDLENKTMMMGCTTPTLKIDTNYWFNGSVSILPIYGNGTGRIVLDKLKCFHTFTFDEYIKKGKKHLKIINSTLDSSPNRVSFQFDNLYDGDTFLSDSINQVMNDNWQEIYYDMKSSYMEGFSIVFADLFNRVLARVPLQDLFINA